MEIFFNPNTAYVFLVCGVMVGLLALVTPGTGLLELVAAFLLLMAGYGIATLGINPWALVAVILAVVPFLYALRFTKYRFLLLGASILLVLAGSIFLFVDENGWPAVNPLLAGATSLLAGGFLWVSVEKSIAAMQTTPDQDLGKLIGQIGEAKTKIHQEGSVQAAGELWSARSEKPIPAGSDVEIVGREGFVLIVKKTNQ